MLGRLLDALTTRLEPRIAAAVRAAWDSRRDEERREVRTLISDMEDVLEKFSRVVARQAKRRARDMQDALDEETRPVEPASPELDARTRKRLLRSRLAAGGPRVPHGGQEQ